MKTKIKTVYYCDFCSKRYFQKPIMEQHEKYCLKRPENFPVCFGCENLTSIQHEGNTVDFHCEHFKKYVHTSLFELKRKDFTTYFRPELGGKPQTSTRMPVQCADKIKGSETPKDWVPEPEIY